MRTCTVSFVAPSGAHYSIDLRAESAYEAIGEGLPLLMKNGWREGMAPDMEIVVEVLEPYSRYTVAIRTFVEWCAVMRRSSEETQKQKLQALPMFP